MSKSTKRRRKKPDQDEYEFECGKCKHTEIIKENEDFDMTCSKCGSTSINIFRLLSEEEAGLEEKKKEYVALKREEYDRKIAELQLNAGDIE